MKIDREQLRALMKATLASKPDCVNCDKWLDHVAAYAEACAGGQPIPPELQKMSDHLATCPECEEEFRVLMALICEDRDPPPPR